MEVVRSPQTGIYLFSEFSPAVLAAFSGREFDASRDLVFFLKSLNLDSHRFCTIRQVHGARVLVATCPFTEREGDGLVTRERGLALIVRTADCAPVFFFDPKAQAVGICHVRWRGAKCGIVSRMIETLRDQLGADPHSLEVAIGPTICGNCYEVGEEFQDTFPKGVRGCEGRYFFDLVGAIKGELVWAGVRAKGIREARICTACSGERFFSARREGPDTGRIVSLIVLKWQRCNDSHEESMIPATQIRKGMAILVGDEIHIVLDHRHYTPGNKRGFVQATLRHLKTGKIMQNRFGSEDKVELAHLEPRSVQFLYHDEGDYHFMDLGDYQNFPLPDSVVAEGKCYLKENMELEVLFYQGKPVELRLPKTVTLKVTESPPWVKGDSVTSNMKPAVCETGLKLQVPIFIEAGTEIKVNTETGEYISRA